MITIDDYGFWVLPPPPPPPPSSSSLSFSVCLQSEQSHFANLPASYQELLLTVEESSVRTSAIESLTAILPSLPKPSVTAHLLPMINRLGTREWFTSRISSSLLLPLLIPLLETAELPPLLSLFTTLCNDDTPMVSVVREARSLPLRSAYII